MECRAPASHSENFKFCLFNGQKVQCWDWARAGAGTEPVSSLEGIDHYSILLLHNILFFKSFGVVALCIKSKNYIFFIVILNVVHFLFIQFLFLLLG